MKYYKTEKICAKEIGVEFDENGKITEIEFCGGCEITDKDGCQMKAFALF